MGKKKQQNKLKNTNGPTSMDISTDSPSDTVEAMDTSDVVNMKVDLGVAHRNMKKTAPKRRGQNVRKAKAIERAIAISEKIQEKIVKNETKGHRVNALKSLY
eukprot:TRINITY_DN11652_c0_g1_i2.p1 TRINITY_DN11652_c0_g1~~TRINITY_DN11652_c0_g1_i2.p1  ORF type:complete len:102 (-),score=25.92 TRINITY_DN11652_c0_g1_i2:48-353(-)